MNKLRRFNGTTFVLNAELIECVASNRDTVLTTTNGKKIVVSESVDEIIEKVIQYKAKILLINKLDIL